MVRALISLGHELCVVTAAGDGDGLLPGSPTAPDHRVHRVFELQPIYDVALMDSLAAAERDEVHRRSNYLNLANVQALQSLIAEFEPDVVYLWNLLGLGGLGVLALLAHAGLPWVWHLMDVIPAQLTRFGVGRDQLSRELANFFPGTFILCSDHLLGELLIEGVELGGDVVVIPNWIAVDAVPPRRQPDAAGPLRVMTASGTLAEAKGTHIVIEAAARARALGADFTVDIFGREEDGRFRALSARLGVDEIVRFMGDDRTTRCSSSTVSTICSRFRRGAGSRSRSRRSKRQSEGACR